LRRLIALIIVCPLLAPAVSAQKLSRVKSIGRYWPEGRGKTYRYISSDSTEIGCLEAVMDNFKARNGVIVSCRIREKLGLNLSAVGSGQDISVIGDLTIDVRGYFLSTELEVTINNRSQPLKAEFDSTTNIVSGRWGEGERSFGRRLELDRPVFSCDNYMIDQLEIILAMHDLVPGEKLVVPALSAQRFFLADYEFRVVGRTVVEYGLYADSVWQINMLRPSRQALFVDKAHRLVKLIDFDQKIIAELIRDPFAERADRKKESSDFITDHISRLPVYGLYLIVAAFWLIFPGRDGYRLRWSYLLFVIGGVVYPLIYLTQVPIQELYGMEVLYPAIREGQSVAPYGIFPSIITAMIQETLKLVPLLVLVRMLKPKPITIISLGAFIGAGFGFIEACHIIGPAFQHRTLTSIALAERVFSTMFHIGTAAVIGYGLACKKTFRFFLFAVVVHFILTYSLFFHGVLSFGLLQFLHILISVVVLLLAIWWKWSYRKTISRPRKGGR
jgi:hypothetical protein